MLLTPIKVEGNKKEFCYLMAWPVSKYRTHSAFTKDTMKKRICFLFILLSALSPKIFAGQAGKLGVGVTVGEPFGPTLKYWLDEKSAVDFGFGFNHDGFIYADYLWHDWAITPQPEIGKVGFYIGVGGRFENQRRFDDKIAARMPLGINLLLNRSPVELFGELVPVFQFSPEGDLNLDADIGVRIYFGAGR
jgi:hypothetical protein